MRTWWVFVRTDGGGFMKALVYADNSWTAYQNAKALYGSALMSDNANNC